MKDNKKKTHYVRNAALLTIMFVIWVMAAMMNLGTLPLYSFGVRIFAIVAVLAIISFNMRRKYKDEIK